MKHRILTLVLACAVLGASCGEPLTEVLLVVDTDLEVPAELDEVRVDLIGPDASLKRSEGLIDAESELPKTLAVVHRGGPLGPVRVTVTGFVEGRNVVQRRASFYFVAGEVRILRLDLLRSCTGVSCTSTETCGPEGCRPVDVEESELVPYEEHLAGRLDASDGMDGAVADGGADAGCVVGEETCNGDDDDCDGMVDEDFDLDTDVRHCGSCGNRCPATPANAASACEAGACVLSCDPGFADCDGELSTGCEAALHMPASCGDCSTTCSGGAPLCEETADGFVCVAACAAGTEECSGACVDTSSSPLHCGACGNACTAPDNAVATCMGGDCDFECDPGFADCNGDPADGCESDLKELSNCGACGVLCERANGIASCASGTCELIGCDMLRGNCDGDDDNGCEADLSADLSRCGSCTTACVADPANAAIACESGICEMTCDPGFASCNMDPSDGCEAQLSSDTSCGACGILCEDPTPLCESVGGGGYACTDGCSATVCGSSCVDTDTDVLHCGACDNACTAGMHASPTCDGGSCGAVCDPGFEDCDTDPSTGCEVAVGTDPASCGTCDNVCPVPDHASATCTDGSCGFECDPGWADCNGMASDGCEVDTTSDAGHCGRCGNACTTGAHVSSVACMASACVITGCDGSFEDCDSNPANGCEIDTDVNRNHCGACRNACEGGQTCCSGTCTGPPPHCP